MCCSKVKRFKYGIDLVKVVVVRVLCDVGDYVCLRRSYGSRGVNCDVIGCGFG